MKNIILVLLSLCLVTSCSNEKEKKATVVATNGLNGTNGQDGVNGQDGRDGIDGINGVDGKDGTVCSTRSAPGGAVIECSDGSNVMLFNGTNGTNGANGVNGANGASCNAVRVTGGVFITCGTSSAMVHDGTNLVPTGAEVLYVYNPCGDSPRVVNDEVIFIGASGRVYSYYEDNADSTPYNKQNRSVAILSPGRYRTTDSQDNYCEFTVESPSNYPTVITNEIQFVR